MQPREVIAEVAAVLEIPAARAASMHAEPCHLGGNNRVFTVVADGRKLVAKWYFRHATDQRDRLKAEYAFLCCLKQAGITCVPQPVACDAKRGIGIYEFVDGRKLSADEIDTGYVDQAAEFFFMLNKPGTHQLARDLPNASEACFSIRDHFSMVDARIDRLNSIPGNQPIEAAARAFVEELQENWQSQKTRILRAAKFNPDDVMQERCLSPSDFGFHNALLTARGISFLDFEYAGWDDPAKMAGDFFSHPAIHVDAAYWERFLDITMRYSTDPEYMKARARLLLPVFQTKWCCIILNDFLPDFALRRRFADATFDDEVRKKEQLAKAKQAYARMSLL
jgi:hypothetical protein